MCAILAQQWHANPRPQNPDPPNPPQNLSKTPQNPKIPNTLQTLNSPIPLGPPYDPGYSPTVRSSERGSF